MNVIGKPITVNNHCFVHSGCLRKSNTTHRWFKTMIFIHLLLSFGRTQITGLAEHWEMHPFSSADSVQRQDRFRINLQGELGIATFYYSGELVQETISDPALFWENRQSFLELALPRLDVRIGKQKVEWGLINGWYLLDRINPKDLRYHLFRPLNDIRIGTMMVRTRNQLAGISLEGIWIPEYVHDPPIESGPWRPNIQYQAEGLHTIHFSNEQFENGLSNEFGIRLAGSVSRLNYRLMWFNGYQDNLWTEFSPVNWIVPPEPYGIGELDVDKRTARQTLAGFDLEIPVSQLILQSEYGMEHPFRYDTRMDVSESVVDAAIHMETAESKRSLLMLGVKYSGIFGIRLHGQWIQKRIREYVPSDYFPEREEYTIFNLAGGIPGMQMGLDYWILTDMRRNSGMAKTELYYMYTPRIIVTIGMVSFWGGEDHWIGQYRTQDNYFLKGTFVY